MVYMESLIRGKSLGACFNNSNYNNYIYRIYTESFCRLHGHLAALLASGRVFPDGCLNLFAATENVISSVSGNVCRCFQVPC